MIIPLILIGLVIYAVYRLSQNNHKNYSNQRGASDALDIVDKRYANGEISEEEYSKKKNMLKD